MPGEPTERTALLQSSSSSLVYSETTMEGPPIVVCELQESTESIEREAKDLVEACLLAARTPMPAALRLRPQSAVRVGLGALVDANNVNALVDAIISQFLNREEVQKLIDPLRIDKEIPIDDKGNHVSNIAVEGLTTFGRTADAILSVLEDGSISIEAAMGVKQAQVGLSYAYNPGCCLNLKGDVGAYVEGISIFIRINIRGFQPALSDFNVEFGDPQVRNLTGASWAFNWLARLIANKVISGRKEEIRQLIVSKGREQLGDLLSKVDVLSLIAGRIPVV